MWHIWKLHWDFEVYLWFKAQKHLGAGLPKIMNSGSCSIFLEKTDIDFIEIFRLCAS